MSFCSVITSSWFYWLVPLAIKQNIDSREIISFPENLLNPPHSAWSIKHQRIFSGHLSWASQLVLLPAETISSSIVFLHVPSGLPLFLFPGGAHFKAVSLCVDFCYCSSSAYDPTFSSVSVWHQHNVVDACASAHLSVCDALFTWKFQDATQAAPLKAF